MIDEIQNSPKKPKKSIRNIPRGAVHKKAIKGVSEFFRKHIFFPFQDKGDYLITTDCGTLLRALPVGLLTTLILQ